MRFSNTRETRRISQLGFLASNILAAGNHLYRFEERVIEQLANAIRVVALATSDSTASRNRLMPINARLANTLDTLPLHKVSPDLPELLSDYFDEK